MTTSDPAAVDAQSAENLRQLKRVAKKGAIWVTLTSAVAIPLGYYRSWILGRVGDDGEVVGTYAIILLFINIVLTFVLFGGTSVVTNFLPKIERREEKSAFIFSYSLITAVIAVVFIAAINVFPGFVSFLIQKPVDATTLRILSALVPAVVLSQLVIFCLTGLMEFRYSSVLSQLQLMTVCSLGTAGWLFFPALFQAHAIVFLAGAVGLSNLLVTLAGGWHVSRTLRVFSIQRYLPQRFWRFSSYVHLNSISTFAYKSIDQLFVLSALGTAELGAYFVLLQCAQLISFVPQRIGQVMLASFSRLVAGGDTAALSDAYTKLCRIILILSTPLALFLILFSYPVASVFGSWSGERHQYLLWLALATHVGTLGSINSMLIMAKDRTGPFLVNSIILILIQLLVTWNFLEDWGVFAVIAGKAAGIVSGQIGLFSITMWQLEDLKLGPPKEYWIALAATIAAAVLAYLWEPMPILASIGAFFVVLVSFLLTVRFHPREIAGLLRSRMSPNQKI